MSITDWKYKVCTRKEAATTQSHTKEMKNPINCIDPEAKLPRVPLISVVSGVLAEHQKVVAKILKVFPITAFTRDNNYYAFLFVHCQSCYIFHGEEIPSSWMRFTFL